jgi:hypothetical protein
MIPQADITARMTAKDKEGNFFCARCTVDLAGQMGVKLGGPRGTQPPAGMPGQTVILSRAALTRPQPPQRPGSAPRIETATHPGSVRPGSGTVARPGTGPVPRVGSGTVARPGSSPRLGTAAPGRATTAPLPGTGRMMTTRRMPPPPPPEEPQEEYYEDEGAPPPPPPPSRRISQKTLALLSVGVVVVVAIIFTIVMMQKSAENRDRLARYQTAKKALASLDNAILERPRDFERHLELARDFSEKAKIVPEYVKEGAARLRQAEEAVKENKAARAAANELDALERDAEDPKNADRLLKDLDKLKPRLDSRNADVMGRFDVVQKKAAAQRVLSVFNEAKTIAEKEPNSHDAILAKLGEAHAAALKVGSSVDYLIKDILDMDDHVANQKYTPDFEAKVDWIDLMSSEWKGQWKKSKPEEAIDAQTGGSEWAVSGKEIPGVTFGVFYIGADKGWRDFIAELEVKIEKRGLGFFGRCGRSENVIRYDIEAKPNSGIEEGGTYKVKITVKGMKGKASISDVGDEDLKIPASVAPSGGIGITLEGGAKVTLKSFKVKVLRAETK